MTPRVCIVTGGLGAIGGAVASRFLRASDSVFVVDLDNPRAEERLAEIAAGSDKARFLALDVRDSAMCQAVVDQIRREAGPIHVLVNCAGGGLAPEFPEQDDASWESIRASNLDGTFYISRAVTKHMIADGQGGRIVHTSSVSWLTGGPDAAYASAKGGIVSLTFHMARVIAKHGITVNAVVPGIIETPAMHAMFPRDQVKRMIETAGAHTPVGRLGKPDDVASLVQFLASPDAGYINGAIIPITGGRHIPQPLTYI